MKRYTFMIDPDILDRLESISARTGLSKSEQIRQGVRFWLESREWPLKGERSGDVAAPDDWRTRRAAARGRARRRR